MASSTAILVCLIMTITYLNYAVMALHKYPISRQCSIGIEDSEVELYRVLIANATKLVYVHFEYNGTQWDVIKVLHENSKYLLMFGNYETNMFFSLYTLSFGMGHTHVTLKTFPNGCLTDSVTTILLTMSLVSNDLKSLCANDKCFEYLSSTGTVCSQRKGYATLCSVFSKNLVEVLNMPCSNDLVIVIILLFCIILGAVVTISKRFFKHNFICMLLNSKRVMNTFSDIHDISIEESNNYFIEKQSVPCGILSILFDIYIPHFFPSVVMWFKNKSPIKNSSCPFSKVLVYVLIFNSLAMLFLFSIITRSQLLVTCFLLMLFALGLFWLVKVCSRPAMIFIDYNCNDPGSILYGFKDCSCLILTILVILALPLIPFCLTFKLITLFKRYRRTGVRQTCRNLMKYILALVGAFAWLITCFYIALMITMTILLTMIGITTNSVPFLPLVMASIFYWRKISARLFNWYKCFFETVLDKVLSMIEDKSFDIMLQLRQNRFLVVKPRSPMQIQGRLLYIHGTPIFVDRTGTLKLTKTFFHRCVHISNERLQVNAFYVSAKSVRQLICVNIFLVLIALIIKIFGAVGQLSTSYLTLVSIGGGVLPFLIDNFIVKDIPVSDMSADKVLTCYLEHIINSFEETFVIGDDAQTEPNDIPCELEKDSNLVSTGHELSAVTSHLAPNGQKLTTESSHSVTENITANEDISEFDPLLTLNTCQDVKIQIDIAEDVKGSNSEFQGDPNFIDIK